MRVRFDIEQLLSRFGICHVQGRRPGEFSRPGEAVPDFQQRIQAGIDPRLAVEPGQVREIVANVAEASASHRADELVALVHAVPVPKHELRSRSGWLAQDSSALEMCGDLHAREAQHGRREIDEADQPIHPLADSGRRELGEPGRKTHEQGHPCRGLELKALAARQARAVVGIEEDDRVVS